MLAEQPYQFVAEHFRLDDIAQLCDALGVMFDNLRGSTPSSKARELQDYMSRNRRLGDLLEGISHFTAADFEPEKYIYLLIEDHLNAAKLAQLCQDLSPQDCAAWELTPSDLKPYDRNNFFRREKAQLITQKMQENGRLGDLLRTIQRLEPDLNLRAYEKIMQEGPSTPADSRSAAKLAESTGPTLELMTIEYENFDLRIGSEQNGRYPVEVLRSPAGEVFPVWQTFNLDDPEFMALAKYLESLKGRPADAVQLGRKMRDMLFPGEIWSKFRQSRSIVDERGQGLRIRLRIDPPELDQMPWEYCHDELFDFIALDNRTPLVRYPAESLAAESLTTTYPIRVLVVMANPDDPQLAKLDLESEKQIIQEALTPLIDLNLVHLEFIEKATARKLRQTLGDSNYHVLHYFGHGVIKSDGEGALALETDDGRLRELDASQMRALLRSSSGVRVIVLNACQLAAHTEDNPFTGVARSLIRAGVPAVIAMQFKLPQKTAFIFSRNLYEGLARGKPLDQAVTEIRLAAYTDAEDKVYWGIPVLSMRAPDGVIWQPDTTMAAEIAAKLAQAAAQPASQQVAQAVQNVRQQFDTVKARLDAGDVEDVLEELQDVESMLSEDRPNMRRVERKLAGIKLILEIYDSAVTSAVVPAIEYAIAMTQEA